MSASTTKSRATLPRPIDLKAEAMLADVIQPKMYVAAETEPIVPSAVAIRKGVNGSKISVPSRVKVELPPWVSPQNLFIPQDASDPTLLLQDAKDKDKPKLGRNGMLSSIEANADWSGTYFAHVGPMRPEYDLLEAFTLYDVEVFVKQAIDRRISLMFRNGYKVTGKAATRLKYTNKRMNQTAYLMKKTWANFMREILTTLSLCSNCFLLKIRDEHASGGVANDLNRNRTPIAGYAMIPPHMLFPYLVKGRITKWRRFFAWSEKPWEDYNPEDIIHLYWNRKPGHIFGTPRTQAVRDDIFAIRRMEENIELLFINYLFPLFHVKIGTEKAPAKYLPGGVSEVEHTRQLINTMPKEGVLVTDERVSVDLIGANGQAMDPAFFLGHLKKRIFTGLGVSAIDMGESDTSNSSTADTVSQALKDSVKCDLDTFADQVSMEIFRDWFEEANFDISVQESLADVKLEFEEIDMDNKVKEENHAVNLYNNNGLTHDEFRKRIKQNPMSEEQEGQTHHAREVVGLAKTQNNLAIKLAKATPRPAAGKKPGGKKGKSGRKASVTKTATAKKKVTQNASTPSNQHGTNNSPRKARSAKMAVGLYTKLLDSLDAALLTDSYEHWPEVSGRVVDQFFDGLKTPDGSSYTNHHRMQIQRLKDQIAAIADQELLLDVISEDPILDADAEGDSNVADQPVSTDQSGGASPEGSTRSGDSESE